MHHSAQRAASLPELLIIMALLALVSTSAMPNFAQWVSDKKQLAVRDQLKNALQSARAQAVLQERAIELCPSEDGFQCGGGWQNGWILRAAKTGEPLTVERLAKIDYPLQWRGYRDKIVFLSNGQTPSSNGRFYLCKDGLPAWQLVISRQGRIRQSTNKENQAESHRCS